MFQRITTLNNLARNSTTSKYPSLWNKLVAIWAPFLNFQSILSSSVNFKNNGELSNIEWQKDYFFSKFLNFSQTSSRVDGIDIGSGFPRGNEPRSIVAWVKTTSTSGDYGVLHWGTNAPSPAASNYHLFLGNGKIGLGNGFGFGVISGSTNIADNKWHCIIGTTNELGNAEVFLDGKTDGSGNLSSVPNTLSGNKWTLGCFMTSGSFPGGIGSVLLYKRTLTKKEIRILSSSPNITPLVPKKISRIGKFFPRISKSQVIFFD